MLNCYFEGYSLLFFIGQLGRMTGNRMRGKEGLEPSAAAASVENEIKKY